MTTIHYPAKPYSDLKRAQLVQLAYALEDQRDRALRKLAELQQPEPTWRDVIRAMRAAGIKLAGPEQISERWRYRALDYNGVEAGDVATNHLGDRWVTLHGQRDGWTFEMKNPTPAEVLTAARLVGLDGARS